MTLTCLCSHTADDHPGGECVHRSCGCLEFRLDPRSRLRDESAEEGGGMSDWNVQTPPPSTPDCEPHTPSPPGYLAHAEWMEEMGKTHDVRRCRGCMRFLIWEPKDAEGAA